MKPWSCWCDRTNYNVFGKDGGMRLYEASVSGLQLSVMRLTARGDDDAWFLECHALWLREVKLTNKVPKLAFREAVEICARKIQDLQQAADLLLADTPKE